MKKYIGAFLLVLFLSALSFAQTRIKYNNRDIFLSGSNVAWINFSADIGRGNPNIYDFNQMFKTVHQNGGNSMRFWLHTTCANSPEFNSAKMVIGPGQYTISDLKKILDAAQANNMGLMLCLWSFDMLRTSYGSAVTDKAKLMLTDTAYTNAYIRNCLIPMVNAVKGHPAILAWEVFNEPEGMSDEYGWDFTLHVPMSNIKRFVNLVSGAIHRTDPKALVTNGSWSFIAQTDIGVTALAKRSFEDNLILPDADSQRKIEEEFRQKYGEDLVVKDIVRQFGMRYSSIQANTNQYRDDRLITAGGDSLGVLDFYTVHYYDWAGISLSPFHYPASHWKLDKPVAVSEFYVKDTYGVQAKDLFDTLYNNGYAGAMSWAWYNNTTEQAAMSGVMKSLYENYGSEVDAYPVPGSIYSFKASPILIEKGDSASLKWSASEGSVVMLDNVNVPVKGSLTIKPEITSYYKLVASGQNTSTLNAKIEVLPSGKILAFNALPGQIAAGEKSLLKWTTTRGSSVTLNGMNVNGKDSLEVTSSENKSYKLTAHGEITDSASVFVNVVPASLIDRALNRKITVSSSEAGKGHENPLYVVDGDTNTYWTSAYQDLQSLEIDLGAIYDVNKIVIKWGDSFALKYRVGSSIDKSTYQLITSNLNAAGGTTLFDNLNNTMRYLKIMLDKRSTQYGYSIKEVEVYGLQKYISQVDNRESTRPGLFYLSQNYPNPFNPVTTFEYSVPEDCFVKLEIFDVLGNKVADVVNEYKTTGSYKAAFNGEKLASGVYYYNIKAGDFTKAGKMILLK